MDAREAQPIPTCFGIAAIRIDGVDSGLVNRTFVVTDRGGARYILQWVNPVFGTDVNEDIDAVTAHLAARGLLTPRLLRTPGGAASVPGRTGHWRMMTHIDGDTVNRAASERVAREAGIVLGRFHAAVSDFSLPFRHRRPFVHDTARYLARLRDAVARRRNHARYARIAPLAEAILAHADTLPPLPPLPERVVHGDPKISNILFHRDTGAGLCMVDLDTVGRMALPLELGDALRSWCNLAGEDERNAEFSADRFRAALAGYAEAAPRLLAAPEIASLVPATRRICVELAARFCTDALDEDYFGWDPARFPSHSEHSEVRAAGQLDAARAVARLAPELDRIAAASLPH